MQSPGQILSLLSPRKLAKGSETREHGLRRCRAHTKLMRGCREGFYRLYVNYASSLLAAARLCLSPGYRAENQLRILVPVFGV